MTSDDQMCDFSGQIELVDAAHFLDLVRQLLLDARAESATIQGIRRSWISLSTGQGSRVVRAKWQCSRAPLHALDWTHFREAREKDG